MTELHAKAKALHQVVGQALFGKPMPPVLHKAFSELAKALAEPTRAADADVLAEYLAAYHAAQVQAAEQIWSSIRMCGGEPQWYDPVERGS